MSTNPPELKVGQQYWHVKSHLTDEESKRHLPARISTDEESKRHLPARISTDEESKRHLPARISTDEESKRHLPVRISTVYSSISAAQGNLEKQRPLPRHSSPTEARPVLASFLYVSESWTINTELEKILAMECIRMIVTPTKTAPQMRKTKTGSLIEP
ncbi:hypothetical protein Bpfe_022851 [Biomphalaria pfeifferi]|uniref:Uncharacterized protein n=1 Tax=Biomphalaria pfeifferi TaxID=112525 RepID=A0AAD8B450_BIOPF|nr:hypothetical protein Bpfe_022851 [Biomphalaria pfeifferi]